MIERIDQPAPPPASRPSRKGPSSGRTALDPRGLPDFLLIGAMKSGTSSVHHLLAHHPDVYIPRGEVFFFDVDDVEQHPDFFPHGPGGRVVHDFERDLELYLRWYRDLFRGARPGQILGEDSTTYLASRVAPARVSQYLPGARLVAMLRDPVARAYSHYWHNVARGREVRTFEEVVHERPETYLSRGLYREQLERWIRCCGRAQLKVIFFEDFRASPQAVLDDLSDFLGLRRAVDVREVSSHRNASRGPIHVPTRLLVNRVLRPIAARRYHARVPNMPGYRPRSVRTEIHRHPLVDRLEDLWNAVLPRRRPPPMSEDTRRFLQRFYRQRNAGLGRLLGEDVARRWPYMERS